MSVGIHDGRFLRKFNEKMDRTLGTNQLTEREREQRFSATVIEDRAMKNEF